MHAAYATHACWEGRTLPKRHARLMPISIPVNAVSNIYQCSQVIKLRVSDSREGVAAESSGAREQCGKVHRGSYRASLGKHGAKLVPGHLDVASLQLPAAAQAAMSSLRLG